jgi:hypothetical protein
VNSSFLGRVLVEQRVSLLCADERKAVWIQQICLGGLIPINVLVVNLASFERDHNDHRNGDPPAGRLDTREHDAEHPIVGKG